MLDTNAAGWGWFVDATPHNDSEFVTPGNQGEQHRIDLLTVLEHELGHLLGSEHTDSGVMEESLTVGTRRTPVVRDQAEELSLENDSSGSVGSVRGLELLGNDVLFALLGNEHRRQNGSRP